MTLMQSLIDARQDGITRDGRRVTGIRVIDGPRYPFSGVNDAFHNNTFTPDGHRFELETNHPSDVIGPWIEKSKAKWVTLPVEWKTRAHPTKPGRIQYKDKRK